MSDDALTQTPAPTPSPTLRRRALAVSTGLLLGSVALPAMATPSTWDDAEAPSLVRALIEIGGPVLAVLAIIALLTYLPSMMGRGGSRDAGQGDPEWFGGPRTGVKTDQPGVAEGSGGSGARW